MALFTPTQITLLSGIIVRVDLMAEFQFKSETMYAWNGNTELVVGGRTWLPCYGAATVDGLSMSGGSTSETVTITLNGLPSQPNDFLRVALEETPDVVQQMIIIYVQLFDESWVPVGTPTAVFWGFMQPPRVSRSPMQYEQGGEQSITLVAENAFFNRSRPPYGRFTDRDQQTRHPGDLAFQFVPSLLNKRIVYPDN
jgi:hypothetical protein